MPDASDRNRRRWRLCLLLGITVVTGMVAVPIATAATGPGPIAVTPYTGFNSLLTRAPYVTDLTQSSADVTWATSASAAGTLQWGPVGNCTANQAAVPSTLPTLVPASGSPPSATGRQFTVNSTSEYQSTVVLTGLSPSTAYCYRPLSSGAVDLLGTNPSPKFTTLDPVGSSSPLTFDVMGDLGETLYSSSTPFPNNLNTDQAAIDSLIGSSGAKFVVTAGDVGYSGGTQDNYGDLTQTGSEVSDIFGSSYWPEMGGLPVFAGEGNHGQNVIGLRSWPESNTASASTPQGTYAFDSYPAPTQDGTNPGTYPDGWYAVSTGNVRIYVLDAAWADGSNVGTANGAACGATASGCVGYQVDHDEHWTPSSPEYQWLQKDLAAHPGTVKMAVWHYPLRSDNPSQPSDVYLQNSAANPTQSTSLESLLAANGVQVVFNGHAHTYQRIAPNNYQMNGQVVNYVTGGGGAILEPVTTGSTCSALQSSESIYAIGWSPTSNTGTNCGPGTTAPTSAAQVFNFLKVTVTGNSVTVTPINAAGQAFDTQTYTFSGSTAPTAVIDSAPNADTNSTTATVAFHSTVAGSTFTCSLDGAAGSACTSPVTYTGLAPGAHTFSVTATSAGTVSTPAVANWTIDTSPPTIPTNLAGNAPSSSEVDLSWTGSTDNTGVAGYDVIRNGSVIASTSGTGTTYADKTVAPSRTYHYAVDARDAAGNSSAPTTVVDVTTPSPPSGPVLVQAGGSSTTTVTLPAASTPGDLLVLSASVSTGKSKPITAVSDGKNAWTRVGAYAVSGVTSDGEMWYAPNAASVTSVTVKTAAPTVALRLQEFSGVATANPLDGSIGSAATGTAAGSGQVTPTGPNDLAVGFIGGHGSTQAITVTSTGYTVQPQQSASNVTVVTGNQDLGSASAQSFGGSFPTAMYWAAGVALFKAGSGSPPPNDFSMTATPSSATVAAGSGTTSTISTSVTSGTAQSVALSATGAPSGTVVSFNPQTITAGQSSTMSVTTSTSTPTGTSTITVTGTGASAVHSTPLSLTVTTAPPNDFSIAATPSSATVAAGSGTTSTISTTVTSGTAQSVALSATGAPSGSLVSFNPQTITAGQSSTMSVTTSTSTPAGTSTITVTGTGASAVHSTPLSLTVTTAPPNDFSMAATPSSTTVAAGSGTTSTISTTVTSGTAQSVALSATGAPSGSLVSFNPQTITAGQSSTMSVTTATSTPTGTSTITVTGTGASAVHSTPLSLTVTPVSGSTPHLVQSASGTETTTAPSLSGTFPSATKAGDLLVLSASEYNGATNHITSVTDSAGNLWTRIGSFDVSGHNSNGEMWYSANAAPATVVTAHNASAVSMAFEVLEFSGVATASPVATSAGISNTSTTASSGTATSSLANELAVGFIAGHGNSQQITVTSPGYTTQSQQNTSGSIATVITGYQVLGTPGAQSFSGTFATGMYWAAGIALFKSAG